MTLLLGRTATITLQLLTLVLMMSIVLDIRFVLMSLRMLSELLHKTTALLRLRLALVVAHPPPQPSYCHGVLRDDGLGALRNGISIVFPASASSRYGASRGQVDRLTVAELNTLDHD
jgi:Co/Zn/Cd efflux system component